ncbi:SDR family oxidoreductase [Allobranchiibius sp. CTAmp26]|uniref:SDR family oxidoreductase n=1 Tax=Allobranchiibius sp. CTAmp26 TaxID=2815214 RepID=UPI001AA0EB65|nr:SDR family oxidoreductase [Allobranchiibius sp. CTAmp26]MBO1754432.1 SDR family oxidoreductase [Allobranchiibius sp. CTAmp26]
MSRLSGKTALVTGASRGIGLGIARQIVAEGGRVVITARKQEALDEAAAELGGPDVVVAVAGKADDPAHQQQAIDTAIRTFGSLDLLVNNAGINPSFGPLVDVDLAAARKTTEVNAIAVLSWVQLAYRSWMREHGGSIVNVASVAGVRPAPGISLYGATKAMLISLTESLAVELGPTIRVNAVAPAVVKTQFAQALYAEGEEKASADYPLKRLGEPEDIATAVTYFLSADSSWVTGQTLVLDGGITLRGGV